MSGLNIAGLIAAAYLVFGRSGWLGKIAGLFLGMMLIGNNAGVVRTVPRKRYRGHRRRHSLRRNKRKAEE